MGVKKGLIKSLAWLSLEFRLETCAWYEIISTEIGVAVVIMLRCHEIAVESYMQGRIRFRDGEKM
jgi:hypothetical protein